MPFKYDYIINLERIKKELKEIVPDDVIGDVGKIVDKYIDDYRKEQQKYINNLHEQFRKEYGY